MVVKTATILEGYRETHRPGSLESRVAGLIGDGTIYSLGRHGNHDRYAVTWPNRRTLRFQIHLLELTCVADLALTVIRHLKKALQDDTDRIREYEYFQGQGQGYY